MIDEIQVKDLALIRDGAIVPDPSLTAITGETGAGKTALLQACKLLMGARADKSLIREGESHAQVEGRFFVPECGEADGAFAEDGFPESEIVVRRTMSLDGRSRVLINGNMASVNELNGKVGSLIDLCSQHDQQKLLHATAQREILDLFGGKKNKELLDEYRACYEHAKECEDVLNGIIEARLANGASLEEAEFVIRKIRELNPVEGEYEELIQTLEMSENSELLSTASNRAYDLISSEDGILDRLNETIVEIETAARYDGSINSSLENLREASYLLEDVSRDILQFRDSIEFDPEILQFNQERVAGYQSLMRQFGPTIEDVFMSYDEANRKVEIIDNADEVEAKARKDLEAANRDLEAAAEALSANRADNASELSRRINEILADLEMGSAQVLCRVEKNKRCDFTINGGDEIELLFRPAASMQLRPLARIASGGELSRVMLAIHVVMGERDSVSTLIFDEIDAGVGGSAANALADIIRRLSTTHQVIVVTHLAQVAARADKQYVVRKSEKDDVVETSILQVSDQDRLEEIARMLSGNITETSLAHAKEMLCADKI